MLSMFCLTASYSRIRFFRLPYLAYSRSFSSDSLEYSSRSLARSGSLSPTPAAFSARADASKRMISRSRPRRYFSLSRDSVCIDDETLAEAISALPVDRRDIILLSYFLDMSDAEIANVLNMVRRSVAYRRTSTLKLLKNLMGGENR